MAEVMSREEVQEPWGKVLRYDIKRPWLSDQVETLPDIPALRLWKTQYPLQNKKRMTELELWPLFVCYRLYDHDGRQLDLEDIHAMMRMFFYGRDYVLEPRLFDNIDEPKVRESDMGNELCTKAKDTHYTLDWIKRIDGWYEELQNNDPDVKAKAEELSGFKGRLEFDPEILSHNQAEQSRARAAPNQKRMKTFPLYQHLFIYGVNHWGRDEQNKLLDGETKLNIILDHYHLDEAALTMNDIKFLTGDPSVGAKLVKSIGPRVDRARLFFEGKVEEAQREYAERKRGPPANPTIEAVTQSMEASSIEAVTQSMEASSIEAVTRSMGTSSLQASDTAITGSTRGPARRPDVRPAAQHPSQQQYEDEERALAQAEAISRWENERRELANPPARREHPNLVDPYSTPYLPQQSPQGTGPRSAMRASYMQTPQAQGPPSDPPNPYQQAPQGTGPTSAMGSSYMQTPQAQDPPSDPPNTYQQPPQGFGPPPTLQNPVRLPSLSEGFPTIDPTMPPQPNPPRRGPPPSFADPVVQRQQQSQRQEQPPRQDPSRQSGDARGSDKRKKDSDKRKKDSESPPKSSEKKKRRGDRGGQK